MREKVILLERNRDFWRGVIDGDGSVWFQGNSRPAIGLTSGRPIVEQFVEYVRTLAPFYRAKPTRAGKIWAARAHGTAAVEVIRSLYADCCVALERKLDAARLAMAWRSQTARHDWRGFSYADLLNLHERFGTWEKVAEHFGMTASGFHKVLHAKRYQPARQR